jgi:alkylation response protein AidB-like acyl-CoA dehydrogenase
MNDTSRNENIAMIRDSAAGVAPPGAGLQRIRALRFRQPGFDRAVWQQICNMGWPALRVPEADGGSELGMQEFCALAEELGAALVPEPLIPCAMAARLLAGAPLAQLIAGEKIVIAAWQESANSLATDGATRCIDGRVSGRKLFVPMADGADAFVVTTTDGPVLVQADAPGLSLVLEPTQDGGCFGTLSLADAPAQQLCAGDVAAALDEAVLATSAYLLGLTERAFAMTLDYLKTRKQFGRLIGSFQALQHRAVDLRIQIALTRASVESAAATFDAGPAPDVRQAAASRAKARAAETAMLVTRQAIQLHGAIGYTDEYDVGLYLRKAMTLANLYGSADVHRARFAALNPGE